MLDKLLEFFRVDEELEVKINVSVALLGANDEASVSTCDLTSGSTGVVL